MSSSWREAHLRAAAAAVVAIGDGGREHCQVAALAGALAAGSVW